MWNDECENENTKNGIGVEFPCKVKISANSITVYTGAGSGYVTVGSVSNGDRPEITEVKKDKNKALWGKLKSGAGWIPLNEVTVSDDGRKNEC